MATMNATKVRRLLDCIDNDMRELKTNREKNVDFIRQYIGKNYSTKGTFEEVPLNLIELMVNTYTSNLVSQNPAASVTTAFKDLKPVAYALKLALDHLAMEINLGETLRKTVCNSLFSIGITKTGLNKSKVVEMGGITHDVGQPFVDLVQLDDFVFDTKAYSWEQCSYIGDRCKLSIKDLKDSGLFNQAVVKKIQPMEDSYYSRNMSEGERASDLSDNEELPHSDDFYSMCQIWNLWLPKENLIVFLADDDGITEPLAVEEWYGPETGPYDFLDYNHVPGNIMPLPPVATVVDLHELTNTLFNKVGRQAKRQKTILGYKGGVVKDAERIVNSNDGEVIMMNDPNGAKEFKYGGPDQLVTGLVVQLRNYFSMFAGNLDALGGLGAQADTLGQEQLIKESVSLRMTAMQDRVVKLTQSVFRKLAWYIWTDPTIKMPLVKRVEGTDVEIPFNLTPDMMEGDFLDYNIQITPYSLRYQTPAQVVSSVVETLNLLAPHMQFMQQQGLQIDYSEVVDLIASNKNIPQLRDVITGGTIGKNLQPVGEMPAKISGMAKKQYEHTYTSKGSVQGVEGQMAQQMFGNMQGNQAQQMMGMQ